MNEGRVNRGSAPAHKGVRLLGAAATIALLAGACGGSATASPSGSAGSSGGTTINVLVEGGGYGEQVAVAKAFEIATGNHVNFIQAPYQGVFDKFSAEMAAKAGAYDVATIDEVWLPTFAPSLVPLDSMFTDAVKANLFPHEVAVAQQGGHFVGMPTWDNAEIIYYRSDLFGDAKNQSDFKAKFGYDLKPPTTWQQYIDEAQFFTQKDASGNVTMYGSTVTGAEDSDFENLSLQAGSPGAVLDANGKSIISNQGSVAGLQFVTDLVCKYKVAPPNVASADWNATQNFFYQGKAALMMFWGHAYRQVPSDAPVVGKIGVAPMIAGSAGVGAAPGPWFNVIPTSSKHQDVAQQFVQFAYEHNDFGLDSALGLAATKSAYNSVAGKPGYENIAPLLATLGGPVTKDRPLVADWQKIVDNVLIPTVQQAVACGSSPSDLLGKADAQLKSMGH